MKQVSLLLWMVFWLIACQSAPDATAEPAAIPSSTRLTPTVETSPVTDITSNHQTTATPTTVPAIPQAAPAPGGTVLLGVSGQPDTLNPVIERHSTLWQITPLMFDSLLQVDPDTAGLVPGLAERWEYSADGRQVTFFLPADLSWSDGTPFTAADVAESLKVTEHPALLSFSEIEAADEQTLNFTFLSVDCAAVTNLATLPLLPAEQIQASQPVGSGPFMLVDGFTVDQPVRLVRNPFYHSDRPWLDEVTVRFLSDQELPLVLSEGAGQFDTIGPLETPAPPPPGFQQETYPAAEMVYVAINRAPRNDPPLPPAVQKALPLIVDRESILNEIIGGGGTLLAGPLLPSHWAANKALQPPQTKPDEARLLLAQAGLRDSDQDGWFDNDGDRLDFSIRLNGLDKLHQRLGWLVSSYYRDLGLFARAESVPPDSVIDDLFTHDFTLAIFRWPVLPDPDQRLYWHSAENEEGLGLNFTSYNNAELDRLLEAGVSVPGCQPQERGKIYEQVQDILAQDRPVDFILAPHNQLLVNNRLAGPTPGPFAPFTWNVAQWYLQDGGN